MLPDSFPLVHPRMVGGPDRSGRVGLAFDLPDGAEVMRLSLSVRDAWELYELLGAALLRGRGGPLRHLHQPGTADGFQSPISSASPSADGSQPGGAST